MAGTSITAVQDLVRIQHNLENFDPHKEEQKSTKKRESIGRLHILFSEFDSPHNQPSIIPDKANADTQDRVMLQTELIINII